MFDGSELAIAIASDPDDLESAIAAYEEAMFTRSEAEASDGHVLLDLCLGDTAPFGFVDFLAGADRADDLDRGVPALDSREHRS